MGSYLCEWHSAHIIVSPSHVAEVVATRSLTALVQYSSSSPPPSSLDLVLRLKPVAIFCSRVALGNRSPASWSIVNWSKGMLRLKALITHSRYGHIERARSTW